MRLLFLMATVLISLQARGEEDQNSTFHMQATAVTQKHGPFRSPYEGSNPSADQTSMGNSLSPVSETQTSLTWTIFAGHRLWKGAEFYINPELVGGSGLSHTLGVAGYPNGEIYRVDNPSAKWNLSRMFIKQTFGWGEENETFKDDKNQIASSQSVRRFTVVLGKFSLNDFFDNNTFSHDPRTQFLNWSFMDNGAWDYAADTRGYSWGIYLELNQPDWTLRWATVQVPLQANQLEMDDNFPVDRGDNLEFEYRYKMNEKRGAMRWMAYNNTANMGNYRRTIDDPALGMNITKSRSRSSKYGFGLNVEQELTSDVGAFGRLGWNDGHTETWAFTEIDRTASLGAISKGSKWNRPNDVAGLAYVVNMLSSDHRDYLANGGYGFIIGDGKLSYSPEQIAEFFYSYRVMEGLNVTGDYQFVQNPAYNSDRGPVSIFAVRLHCEI